MYESLRKHCPDFKIWMLCLDEQAHLELSRLNLSGVVLVALSELEDNDGPLLEAKKSRSLLEYYFTCTPSLPLYVLNQDPAVDLITYLDADLFFVSNVEPVFAEIGNHSIAIIPHGFTKAFKKWEWNGIFNVGWVTFRRDQNGLACLRWWRERCLEWCYDRVEDNRFADQKYLDDWPSRFQNVVILKHKGANLAPWNIGNYKVSTRGDDVFVDDQPLIFFHFHGFKQLSRWIYDTQLGKYKITPPEIVIREIFAPYVKAVSSQMARLQKSDQPPLATLRKKAGWILTGWMPLLRRQYLIVVNGRVL